LVGPKSKAVPGDACADGDKLEDEMGFRTIETDGTRYCLNGKPIFLRGISIHAEAPYPAAAPTTTKTFHPARWRENWDATMSALSTIRTMSG